MAVRKNQTIEIVCEALGWAPAPHITWMVNNISVANSGYITGQSQGSSGLYNEESILTLTPATNSTVTCLAAIDALSKPQYATMTFFVLDEPPPSKCIMLSAHFFFVFKFYYFGLYYLICTTEGKIIWLQSTVGLSVRTSCKEHFKPNESQ